VPDVIDKVATAIDLFAAMETPAWIESVELNVNAKAVTLPFNVAVPNGAIEPVPVIEGVSAPKTPVKLPLKLKETGVVAVTV